MSMRKNSPYQKCWAQLKTGVALQLKTNTEDVESVKKGLINCKSRDSEFVLDFPNARLDFLYDEQALLLHVVLLGVR